MNNESNRPYLVTDVCLVLFLVSPPSPSSLQALCPGSEVTRSDVYHLAVNLMDRFLSYETLKSEKDLYATSAACAMISLKILRAREECLSYDYLRYHFHRVPESRIRVRNTG